MEQEFSKEIHALRDYFTVVICGLEIDRIDMSVVAMQHAAELLIHIAQGPSGN